MRIIRFLGEDGRVHHGEDHGDGTATVLMDPHGLLGPAQSFDRRHLFRGMHALVADDDENMRAMMAAVLDKVGCHCTVCADGAEAIAAIDNEPLDLVVSDILMPHRNGYEIFAAAKKRRRNIPVVLVTGFGYDPHHSLVRAAEEGFDTVLYKPFTPQELIEELDKAVCAANDDPAESLLLDIHRYAVRKLLSPLEPTSVVFVHFDSPDAGRSGNDGAGNDISFHAEPEAAITSEGETILFQEGRGADFAMSSGGELAIVIGASARDIPEEDALGCVLGYTVANVMCGHKPHSDRNAGGRRGHFRLELPCSLGPALLTRHDIRNPDELIIRTSVNGTPVRSGLASSMFGPAAALISRLSRDISLEPGVVVLTGLPPLSQETGNGDIAIKDGDLVEVEIEPIGKLVNRVTIA